MNKKFVSKSNFVLRRVLNTNDSIEILKDFVESILNISIEEITLNPYLTTKEKYLPREENFGIADMRIKQNNGEELNVGIQIIDGMFVQNKMLLYYAQIHANQLEQGYKKVVRTVTINILYCNYFNSSGYHKRIHVKDNPERQNVPESIELHVIELEKFKSFVKENLTKEEAWVCYLNGEHVDGVIKKFDKIKILDDKLNGYWKGEKME